MSTPHEIGDADTDAFYRQIRRAVDRLDSDSDLGEIEWCLYQLARINLGLAAEAQVLRIIKRNTRVSMRVARAALICQQERSARHQRKREKKPK